MWQSALGTNWVRLLHRRMKEMHWDPCVPVSGFPRNPCTHCGRRGNLAPGRIPGLVWRTGWSKWPAPLKSDELSAEYQESIRERWNHPSVVIWDASNETTSTETGKAVHQVRALDLSHRPWDNSYGTPRVPGDVFESHPYHFQNAKFKLADLERRRDCSPGQRTAQSGRFARDYQRIRLALAQSRWDPHHPNRGTVPEPARDDSTTAQRRTAYARYLAAETEFWRSHRQAAGVMHFTALGYSRASGQTSDHWLDVARLKWEPEFFKYVRDAFSPVAVMIDDWAGVYPAGKTHDFSVVVLNDEPRAWAGKLKFMLLRDGRTLQEQTFKARLGRWEERRSKPAWRSLPPAGLTRLRQSWILHPVRCAALRFLPRFDRSQFECAVITRVRFGRAVTFFNGFSFAIPHSFRYDNPMNSPRSTPSAPEVPS